MKKVIFAVMALVLATAHAWAGSDVKLTSGSVKALKEGGTGFVILDMADTMYDNKVPLRQDGRFANVDEQLAECTSEFIREFNENTGKFTLTDNTETAQYEFLVKITNLDTYINVMSFKGGVGIKLWGTITITDKSSGEQVAVYKIDEAGNSGFTYQIALEEGFEGIAKDLAKSIKKGK